MKKSTFDEYIGFIIVIFIGIILFVAACFIPEHSVYNKVIATFGSLVTIAGAFASYMAWSNTKKLIAQRKLSELEIADTDIIIGIECLHTQTGIEESIFKAAYNELPELKKLVEGSEITVTGNRDLGIPGSSFEMKVSNKINRGIIIIGEKMPIKTQAETEQYVYDFRETIKRLYEMLSKTDCETVHLFLAAPVALATIIVPYFVNKMQITVYHHDLKSGRYIKIGLIDERSE